MINADRLNELIKEEANIYINTPEKYYVDYSEPYSKKVKLSKKTAEIETNEYGDKYLLQKNMPHALKNLYETKDELIFARKFKKIRKVSYLSFPTWDEIKDKIGTICTFYGSGKIYDILILYDDTYSNKYFYLQPQDYECKQFALLTEDNYIKVCRKAKRLFLGDENNATTD